jgi:hypothetical protein
MTTISKCLVVFAVIASFAILGFSAVGYFGGTNWETESEKLTGYSFTKEGVESTSWSVIERITQRNVGSNMSLPAAVIAARQDIVSQQRDKIAPLDEQIPQVEAKLAEARELISTDEAALLTRATELSAELDANEAQFIALSNQVTDKTRQGYRIQAEARERREDVLRLTDELALVRTDGYRTGEQLKKLTNTLNQYQLDMARARERNASVRAAVSSP